MEKTNLPNAGKLSSFDELATRALDPTQTDTLFLRDEGLFVEICARWIISGSQSGSKIAALGRVVSLAPHLAEHVDRFLASKSESPIFGNGDSNPTLSKIPDQEIIECILGTYRLLSFDCRTFEKYVRLVPLQRLFGHPSRPVRYLAVRTFCLKVHAADYATQKMIRENLGDEEVMGPWEEQNSIDYRLLSLYEENRWKTLQSKLLEIRSGNTTAKSRRIYTSLSPYTVDVNGILLPRLDGAPSQDKPFDLVSTPTTEYNLEAIAKSLLQSQPILLTGLAGSGKTLLVRHFAWQLNKLDTMVTLHLNEQSDAKLLVGMYATGAKPGTFSWRPGVLTTAVKEGRWIFIEDLDRAPNEIISTLLPLIERGELLIPSRGETIQAARGFRIVATMRSILNPRGQEIVPRQNMIGSRFWNQVTVNMPQLQELESIITSKYSILQQHLSGIMRVYARLLHLFSDAKFSSENGTSIRALTPRDLIKWCDRIAVLLGQSTTFNPSKTDDIFMEAFDCFAGNLRNEQSRHMVMACVAEELHVDPQRRDHLLGSREVKLEISGKQSATGIIQIGRSRLAKHRVPKRQVSGRPFSTNDYTLRLLEKIAVAVDRKEPLLLVGETGTGKTTCIQYLAEQLGRKMVAFNLSQQSEAGDLLGGYKPVNVRSLIIPLKDEFDELFTSTFSKKSNAKFIEILGKSVAKGQWVRVCSLWRKALQMVSEARKKHESRPSSPDPDGGQPRKKRKVDELPENFPGARWDKFASDLHDLEAQIKSGSEAFAFSFLEGNIVKAVRNGDWVLLDEINLASPDTLEALTDLLGAGPDGSPSILLTETGSVERIVAHPNFRVFAAMNPATDVGKKDLPPGIRSRFTELYVESPDSDIKSLRNIVEKYLGGDSTDPAIVKTALDVTNLYIEIQRLAKSNMLVDGADQKAHFSLRTLTRTLNYAREIAPLCTLRRALYEGFNMSFLTFLGKASEDLVAPLILHHLFSQKSSAKSELGRPLQQPGDGRSYVRQGHYWLRQGIYPVEEQHHYIITPFVQRNMNNLIRAASTRRYPVLIQGPTSSGKTSMIEYLAKRSGNKFVRINNHEHTDLQEYLGSYVSGADGKLSFQEGILVRALREGHWIVLDELNLAPTDVLEALNRLLDDNRELLIPETQEVVRPHDDFMLFATQNPAGLYGGRKVLSRAFRNRFLELHFDDIPVEELTEILHRRCEIPESWCKRIVKVYQELSTLRQENRIFEQKSFATLRDLFRWAQRKADTIQDLANNGYMLLAERVRKEEERQAVKKIMETVMSKSGPRVTIDEERMFSEHESVEMKAFNEKTGAGGNVVWTRAMRRLYVLVAHAIRNNEPVLLVGETGCGKTTVCQMLADAFEKQLHIVNAHQNTETGDLIGAQRPIRNRAAIEELLQHQLRSVLQSIHQGANVMEADLVQLLEVYDGLGSVRDDIPTEHREEIHANRIKAAALFEWADGSLVNAMKAGELFLLDEISLADDSVLERLNSVLESSRTLLLAEKGPVDSLITAAEGFQFLATMNPGGDYGKRELSPALRNRFTEIWVPALSDVEDILHIVRSKLKPAVSQSAVSLVSFAQWFNEKYNTSVASSISIRDTLAWVSFVNSFQGEDPAFAIVHGAAMVYIDTLGANPAGLLAISPTTIDEERKACLHRLSKLLGRDVSPFYFGDTSVTVDASSLRLGPFAIPKFSESAAEDASFAMEAPTTRSNAMRVLRALQLSKPILLEGNPGVGKTTLVTAIAKAIGKPLTRLNLSEQTDLMDLFGSDVPVEGGQAGTFAWRDAPFLKAMKKGDWVLLDEMNLASQSVLEGLNAVLDHRGEVYISELDQTFQKHRDFRVFAAQNPHHQGGGRKGLPASFVNRFTVVYADIFRPDDLALICNKVFPSIEASEVEKLINFVAALDENVVQRRTFGALGHPWEFNLRDTLRWLQLIETAGKARDFLDTVFAQRFRTESDRSRLLTLFETIYGQHEPRISPYHNLGLTAFQVGLGTLERDMWVTGPGSAVPLRTTQLGPMEALMVSVQRAWPVILVGSSGAGKSTLLNQLALFAGADLVTFSMNADIDAMDLVGGYEQVDPTRELHRFMARLENDTRQKISCMKKASFDFIRLLELLHQRPENLAHEVHSILLSLAAEVLGSSTCASLADELAQLSKAPKEIKGARFQWVDGVLIQALQEGRWLILDNANLCSSAVLDRLNSLLEPNGYLSINEHSTADGEARIVKPHPKFRIFLTMDQRFGELSRAMRNRAVEIFLLSEQHPVGMNERIDSLPHYALDSSVYRFRHFQAPGTDLALTAEVVTEHLSPVDSKMLSSFQKGVAKGLLNVGLEPSAHLDNRLTNGNSVTSGSNGGIDLTNSTRFLLEVWNPKAVQLQSWFSPNDRGIAPPYHPLADELFLDRNIKSTSIYSWYAWLYENLLYAQGMQNALGQIPPLKFERPPEKRKLGAFLLAFSNTIRACLEATWKLHCSGESITFDMTDLRLLYNCFMELTQGNKFDRATFQTYLKMLNEQLSVDGTSQPVAILKLSISRELTTFGSGVQLQTGLGMERIWTYFKSQTAKNTEQLSAILALEGLADRLDAAMWRSNLSLGEMIQIRERFASSIHLVRSQNVNATELILNLGSAVRELEVGIVEEDTIVTPYFEDEFEGLCQFVDILDSSPRYAEKELSGSLYEVRAKSSLLARRPTRSFINEIGTTPAQHLASLYRFVGLEKGFDRDMALQGRFHVATLAKLHGASEVQLVQLARFESELQVLSQHIALDLDRITRDQSDALSSSFCTRVQNLISSHSDVISDVSQAKITFQKGSELSELYVQVLDEWLPRCRNHELTSYHGDIASKSKAWVEVALAGLALYIPNYPHDPALRPMIERRIFNEEKASLLKKLEGLKSFQLNFTGQNTSLRIRQLQRQIQNMGEEPPVPAIVRPNVSELDALQGYFSNLLSIIKPLLERKISLREASKDNTLGQNISRTIEKLTGDFRAYDDITGPAVGFLVCLKIGLSLGALAETNDENVHRSLEYVTHHTPLFGLSQRAVRPSSAAIFEDFETFIQQGSNAIDIRWHAMKSLVVIRDVDSDYMHVPGVRQGVQNIFASLYTDWKDTLLKDQDREAKNSSLYTYKGDEEDADEADHALFPDYEQEQEEEPENLKESSSTSREHAIRVANTHANLFLGGQNPSKSLQDLLEWCSKEVVRVSGGQAHGTVSDSAFSAILIELEKKSDALISSGAGRNYNFYFDSNLPEAKRMMQLLHRIQQRYRQIQKVWPEHAPLSDVLRTCDEALAFRHVDPVAKLITKLEKLHTYVHEWQRVASREYSTANLYDDLTSLLVSWRQLELTTWARLFDLELEKCKDDAKSWFFVAYETIVAASDSIHDFKSMKAHSKALLKTLESFFSSTTLGQFEQRIVLLTQFREHIKIRKQDEPLFQHIYLALDNFISYFSRLQKPVQEALAKGRQTLEREVNNVIKLASWKDTNIDALKQSAKTSHRKLSKLVRKFRRLINQPVSGIFNAGFPEQNFTAHELVLAHISIDVNPELAGLCDRILSTWAERPTRFKNLITTVSIMRSKSTTSEGSIHGALYIESFINDLETTIAQLQKSTPSTLTEENKETVKHLKTRKRKLYADTMKELRQMGIRSNLSSDILVKQDELSTVIASLPSFSDSKSAITDGADYFLHKSLNIMDQVRAVSKEHSSDLTGNDVTKSIGYLEGLLFTAIQQRGQLSVAIRTFQEIKFPLSSVTELCSSSYQTISRASDEKIEHTAALAATISWLATILHTTARVVRAQARLGKTDEFNAVVDGLQAWSLQFENLKEVYHGLPSLPSNIWCSSHLSFYGLAMTKLSELRKDFEVWYKDYAHPRAILSQIRMYVTDLPELTMAPSSDSTYNDLESHSKRILEVLDLILGAMQDVEATFNDLPASTEDATWLEKEQTVLAASIAALHAPQITKALCSIIEEIHTLSKDEDLQVASALFSTVQPIFAQYLASYEFLLSKFGALHLSTAKLFYRLAKTFIQVGSQGFCTPSEKSTDENKDEKLEGGTGLGAGEGAEDISKDIEDDEDLEDLAQEKGEKREDSIEEEDDAVDMGENEMEGETGDVADKEDEEDDGEGEEGDDVESQVGSVDDLGPSAVDEKMWDEGGKEDDKEKEGKEDVGTENSEEQVAAEGKEKKEDGEQKEQPEGSKEDEEMEGEEQDENVEPGEVEQMDPHAKEEETLDLPEELNLEGNEDDKIDDDLGDMDMDMDDEMEDEMDADAEMGAEPDVVDDNAPDEEGDDEKDTTGHAQDDEEKDEIAEEDQDGDAVPMPDENEPDDKRDERDNQNEANADAGAGIDANEEAHQDQKEQAASAANQQEGNAGELSEQKQETTAPDGELGETAQQDASGHGEEEEKETSESQSFKKLGDVLEKWYNQQRKISDAKEKDEVQQIDKEIDMADADFEHLPDEEAQADTQAMGTATEEQAKAIDHDMAMAIDEEDTVAARPEDDGENDTAKQDNEDVGMEDIQQRDQEEHQESNADGRPQAFVGEQKPFAHEEDQEMNDAIPLEDDITDTSSVKDVENQLELTHLDPSATAMTPDTARSLWIQHESSTHSLSQQLTEHLRLILAPTLATKLRGDFRTGKRLNLKRIIPYIASGYKRDKIWLRRSMPSKRSYQVMIALDDSKSMAESGASNLALKTLTLVTRSLSMLEVGEVSVIGFGKDVNIAHDFDKPFTSESGVRVFEQFGFKADKTDVRKLVDKSLEHFADARGASSAGEDLWQLMLVVSDGICDSHAEIQRLVRKAQEERVMIVFIIIDATAVTTISDPEPGSEAATREKTSILDLQSVEITNEGKVVRWKYMEKFPFRYYLVVRDVRELPGVLAGALRQWFGEVAGSSG
ncbi:hypothetical protein B0J11DRAFT_122747 [Dendryphion nanum]|uniref:Midasin n=1 Tax=Dendryphion nanum TaxID=256645 RepID=A0A9P9ICT7_9PLEO|nr:hypothetical protein B0J11DRAFT_122747 [Dendryphion nanum]